MDYINKELEMWIEGNYIIIQVIKGYEYDAKIEQMGKENEPRGGRNTTWNWIKHLREKNWWNEKNEAKFLELAEITIQKNG